jgi:hypothetical protein
VFGCACYSLLRPYTKHKLEFRSKQCVFLGYSSNQKGYRCLDPASNRIYISRHVIFDEHTFPAKDKAYLTASTEDSPHPPGTTLLPIDFYSINAALDRNSHSTFADTLSHPSTPSNTSASTHTQPNLNSSSLSATETISPAFCPNDSTGSALDESSILESVHLHSAEESPRPEPNHLPLSLEESYAPTPHITTRSQTGHSKPKDFSDFHLYHSRHTTKHPWKAMIATSPPELATFSKAISDPN